MASTGNTKVNKGIPDIMDAFVIIIKTEWNAHIADLLEQGAISVLNNAGIKHRTLVVPGAVEISFAVKACYRNGMIADAFITLGAVIRGDTPHFDFVCTSVTDGITQLNQSLDIPVIFGVLTVNNEQQALDRTGGSQGNKGAEAAVTAIKMIALNRELKKI